MRGRLVCKSDEFQFRLFTNGEEIYPCVTELADIIGKELVENTWPRDEEHHQRSFL